MNNHVYLEIGYVYSVRCNKSASPGEINLAVRTRKLTNNSKFVHSRDKLKPQVTLQWRVHQNSDVDLTFGFAIFSRFRSALVTC